MSSSSIPEMSRANLDRWSEWAWDLDSMCICEGRDRYRHCYSESTFWQASPLFDDAGYYGQVGVCLITAGAVGLVLPPAGAALALAAGGVVCLGLSRLQHDSVLVLYHCHRCGQRFRRTYDFLQSGKQHRNGDYLATFSNRQSIERFCMSHRSIEVAWDNMWYDDYNLLTRNCQHWARDFWNLVKTRRNEEMKSCECPPERWYSMSLILDKGDSEQPRNVAVRYECERCKHSFHRAYWYDSSGTKRFTRSGHSVSIHGVAILSSRISLSDVEMCHCEAFPPTTDDFCARLTVLGLPK